MNTVRLLELTAPYIPVPVALMAGLFTWWNTLRITKQASKLEELKSKLDHQRIVHSTQWTAEFSAYQTIWKSLVALRTLSNKLVMRESELADLGLVQGDVNEQVRLESRIKLVETYAAKLGECTLAINEQAPFYAAEVRQAANVAHEKAWLIFKRQMSAQVSEKKNPLSSHSLPAKTEAEGRDELSALMSDIDQIEGLIRERLSEIQIIA